MMMTLDEEAENHHGQHLLSWLTDKFCHPQSHVTSRAKNWEITDLCNNWISKPCDATLNQQNSSVNDWILYLATLSRLQGIVPLNIYNNFTIIHQKSESKDTFSATRMWFDYCFCLKEWSQWCGSSFCMRHTTRQHETALFKGGGGPCGSAGPLASHGLRRCILQPNLWSRFITKQIWALQALTWACMGYT